MESEREKTDSCTNKNRCDLSNLIEWLQNNKIVVKTARVVRPILPFLCVFLSSYDLYMIHELTPGFS